MVMPSLDFCPLNCHKRSKLQGACLKELLIIPVKEVALKTINYKTIDANPPAFFCERFLNVSPRSNNYEFSVKSCFFDVDMLNSYI